MGFNLTANKKKKESSFNFMQINKLIIKFSKKVPFKDMFFRVRNANCSTQMKCVSNNMHLIKRNNLKCYGPFFFSIMFDSEPIIKNILKTDP